MKKLLLLIVTFVFISGYTLLAQTIVITGTVTSSTKGEGAIPGVTVTVKGTTVGTITDVNGKFTVTAPQSASTLVFSYVGMKRQEVEIGGRKAIDVAMEPELLGLNEVVVTALGIKRESKALGYSVQSVGNDQIQNSSNTDIINSLAGKVAGVHITPSSGAAGASTFIEIRGSTSLTGNNQPLFVVDGIPIQSGGDIGAANGDVAGVSYSDRSIDLNPDDIESMTVLKGGAATALYGLRASNGVILITTKKGTNNTKMKVDFHTSVTFDKISQTQARQNEYAQGSSQGYVGYLEWANGQKYNHVASPADGQPYRNVSWGAKLDTCSYTTDPTWVAPDANIYHYLDMPTYLSKWDANGRIVSMNDPKANGLPVNVYDPYDFFRTGVTYNNSLSISGGNENTSYFASFSNQKQSGIIPNNSFGKTTFKLSGETRLSKRLSSSASMTFIHL
jgi:TonB-dependent SusC/RagA subfamily outer membrane receptor